MRNKVFKLLPSDLVAHSISQEEIVLPLQDALIAVDIFESKGILILGWEGWIKAGDDCIGHCNAPQGTVSLEVLSVQEAADVCRRTMVQDAARWETDNQGTTDELYFCITVHA